MPKLKAPLLSFGARGGLGKLFSLAKRQGRNIIERKPIPVDAKSPAQLFNRHMFTKCVDLWHLLSEEEKQVWESLARPLHMTGYAWFISQCLRPNPGIYLPLQGGKMSGAIDMDGNKIEALPDPIADQEPATKAYADTRSKFVWKDASETAMTDLNRTDPLPYTELDLTPFTSLNAKIAILLLRIRADTVGTGGWSRFSVRKNGTAPAAYPTIAINKDGVTVGSYHFRQVFVGLDTSQTIQYWIAPGVGWQLDTRISVMGYIE